MEARLLRGDSRWARTPVSVLLRRASDTPLPNLGLERSILSPFGLDE
jgi:hypothetical protein